MYLAEIGRAHDRAALDQRRYGWHASALDGIASHIAVDRRDGTAYDGGAKSMSARAIEGLFDTPDAVDAHDGEADLDEVKAMVKRGKLHLRDLVDVGRGWQTVDACGELYDVVSDAEAEARRDAIGTKVIGVVVALLAIAAAIALCGG